MEPILTLQQVCKSFAQGDICTRALNQVDLKVNRGDFIAVQGPSGSGKSTLLAILGLMDKADSGLLQLAGVDVAAIGLQERQRIRNLYLGFIFQSFHLLPHMTVLENVLLPLSFRKDISSTAATAKATAMLETVGLSHRISHYPSQLSGGQQQRVAIARALVGEPAILLADEPTGNLDSENAKSISALLTEFNNRGQSILLVTHDANVASIATRQLFMQDGRLTEATTWQAAS
jgi:putative ABC transport system ATP-binding protein